MITVREASSPYFLCSGVIAPCSTRDAYRGSPAIRDLQRMARPVFR